MMYSRLKLARNLLKEDGAIFISIDDNEIHNLRKICDEVFGAENFVACIAWEKRFTRNNDAKLFSTVIDYILMYRKSAALYKVREPRQEKNNEIYTNPDNDPRGPWTSVSFVSQRTKEERPNLSYAVRNPFNGQEITHPVNAWKYSYEQYKYLSEDNRLYWGKSGENQYPRLKRFLAELDEGIVPINLWNYKDTGTIDDGTKTVDSLIGKDVFDYPKPITLISRMLNLIDDKNCIVLDFFSGSATTAHSVMKLNAEDGGNRKYIMIQLPEPTAEKSEAGKAGFSNICEIGKERIRRAARQVKEETNATIDYGFRVFRVDSSNMKDVYYAPNEIEQGFLINLESNIKEDRTSEDLLIQVMLECGLELSLEMEAKEIHGKKVHFVAGNSLVACFDQDVPEAAIKEIANTQPLRVVFRDSSFNGDSDRINIEELFKMISPSTDIKVI